MSLTPAMIADVQAAIRAVEYANGKAFVNQHNVNARTHDALHMLLRAYGVQELTNVTNADLATLYATARKDVTKGYAVSKRIETKYGSNLIFDDDPPSPPAPPVPTPSPAPAEPRQSVDMAALTNIVREAVERARSGLSATLADHIQHVETRMGEADQRIDAMIGTLPALIADALKAQQPTTLEVTGTGPDAVALGIVHYRTRDILAMLDAGVNVYLYGPAGSGKTTAARKCSEAFKVPFYFAAKVESEYMLLGFKDARGETVRTQFREAYEHGGVFLFDELDGSSPSAVVALNAALANGVCPFPDGIVERHPDFKCIAAGNTKLTGASRQYTGRNQLDAASVDRFAFLEFGYDEKLELALASNKQWCRYVQAARKAVADRALSHLITPRATLDGCKLLAKGMAQETVARSVLWKGLDDATVDQLERAINVHNVSAMAA